MPLSPDDQTHVAALITAGVSQSDLITEFQTQVFTAAVTAQKNSQAVPAIPLLAAPADVISLLSWLVDGSGKDASEARLLAGTIVSGITELQPTSDATAINTLYIDVVKSAFVAAKGILNVNADLRAAAKAAVDAYVAANPS